MKFANVVYEIIRKQFMKHSPNWVFVTINNEFFLKNGKKKIQKVKNGYKICSEGLELISPTPKFFSFGLQLFEDRFERFFKIREGDVVLDVGACIGDTTLPMAIKAGPRGKVIAVEPQPVNAKYLRINTANYNNVQIIEKGIWTEKGTMEFHVHYAPTGHSLLKDSESTRSKINIAVDTLDNMFGSMKIDFAKIDVQGAETYIFEKADKFLNSNTKLIVGTHYRDDKKLRTYPKVIETLRRYGYTVRFEESSDFVYAWR